MPVCVKCSILHYWSCLHEVLLRSYLSYTHVCWDFDVLYCPMETREKGNILEGLVDDEDDDDEEPQYVLTEEWAEFFAKAEARRKESELLNLQR